MGKPLFRINSSVKKYQNLINQINSLEENFKTFTDSELRAANSKLITKYNEKSDLNSFEKGYKCLISILIYSDKP